MSNKRVAGLWSGHDASCCVLDDGVPEIHIELERHIREKEPQGDSMEYLKRYASLEGIDSYVGCYPRQKLSRWPTYPEFSGKLRLYGHHLAHAAHAFYSSNYDEALIVTIDGGGVESDEPYVETATTARVGRGKHLADPATVIPSSSCNVGGLWTRVTRYVFNLQNGWPRGHQAGTVMAMAAFGDGTKWVDDFRTMLRRDLLMASMKPKGQTNPVRVKGGDPVHPYLAPWEKAGEESEQVRFDMAAGLQTATEEYVRGLLSQFFRMYGNMRYLCLSGGVALNSVITGKIREWFPHLEGIYVPPVPYDGGLCLGAAQYHTHHVLGIERVTWKNSFSPYLGDPQGPSVINRDLCEMKERGGERIEIIDWTDRDCVDALDRGDIVSVYNGPAESGRRALGNRSILADPRSKTMKDKVNENVKHRQWFRPFAPSILEESVSDVFVDPIESPYMSFVCHFKDEWKEKVPAVVHVDGSARLQTVGKSIAPWYHGLIDMWREKTGIPLVLNTSFNDSEPIVNDPLHAFDCFFRTDIDWLYFPEIGKALRKKV